MLKFKEYITESEEIVIDTTADLALMSIEKLNDDLDAVTDTTFLNSSIFVNAVRGTLERFGILLPPFSNMQQLAMEGETVYTLGETGYFVYMVHNLDPNGFVEGFAVVVDEADLTDLAQMTELGALEGKEVEPEVSPRKPWIPPARRDDDSGNNDEYA